MRLIFQFSHRSRAAVVANLWFVSIALVGADPPLPSTPLKVLFLGNSLTYTNDVPGLVQNLANAAGDAFTKTQIATGGWDLALHASNSVAAIASGNYDIVVLQQYSTGFVIAQDWAVQILNNSAIAAGGRSLFFNTPSPDFGPSDVNLTQFKQRTDWIRYNYATEGNLYNIAISPTGLAWQTVRLDRPDIGMYAPDGHPSLHGSYLMACVHYASLFGRSPAGNSYTAGLPAADVAYLQSVAEANVFPNPWVIDQYGYGPNHFYWAKEWSQHVSNTNSTLQGIIISGTGSQSSPALKVDSAAGQAGNVYLGVQDTSFATPGQGRLYLFPGGSLTATGNVIVGKEGKGFVEHRHGNLHITGDLVLAEQPSSVGRYALSGGSLSASRIVAGAGAVTFAWTSGRLSFREFGTSAAPLNLTQAGGTLATSDLPDAPAITGNFAQSYGAVLERIAGASGALAINGTATLGGSLLVTYPPAFAPGRGWNCTILSAASVSGTFSQVALPPITDDGIILMISYSTAEVMVTAVQDTSDTDFNGLPDWWERRVFGIATSGKTWHGEFKSSGVANGIAFAVAMEKTTNPSDGMPRIEFVNDTPILHYVQRTGGSGAVGFDYSVDGQVYTIEVRNNLDSAVWQSGNDYVELVSRTDRGDGTETVALRLKSPLYSTATQWFARLVVTRP